MLSTWPAQATSQTLLLKCTAGSTPILHSGWHMASKHSWCSGQYCSTMTCDPGIEHGSVLQCPAFSQPVFFRQQTFKCLTRLLTLLCFAAVCSHLRQGQLLPGCGCGCSTRCLPAIGGLLCPAACGLHPGPHWRRHRSCPGL